MSPDAPERFSMRDPGSQTEHDREYARALDAYFAGSLGGTVDKLRHFTKFVPRQSLALFLAKDALFRRIVTVHGHVLECGVFLGGGVAGWGQLSAIYEPYNHTRRVVGFDTFTGFPAIGAQDRGQSPSYLVEGGLATHAGADLAECIRLYDLNRPLGHIPRIELVAGDATQTIPAYVAANQHLIVALLYLDFDLYEPTRVALEAFVPRMPRGAVLAFDELNQAAWPGETRAVLETLGVRTLRIERFPFTPQLSFAVLD
jgi:hypothetical protein